MAAGDPYTTYEEAKNAAVEDLKKAGWESWRRGKGALDKFTDWSKIEPQIKVDWAVYGWPGKGLEKRRGIIAGVEQYVVHYCIDDVHYYSKVQSAKMPADEEFKKGDRGIIEATAVRDLLPKSKGAVLEGIGHTHILQEFKTDTHGKLSIVSLPVGLSQPDRDLVDTLLKQFSLTVEVYAVETDGKTYSYVSQPK